MMNAARNMWMHCSEASASSDGAHPTVSGPSIEALAIASAQDRAFVSFANGQIDGARRAGDERDSRLVALADDPQHSMSSFEGHVLDLGLAGFA